MNGSQKLLPAAMTSFSSANTIGIGVLAVLCAMGLRLALPGTTAMYYSVGPAPILVAIGFFVLFKKVWPLIDHRKKSRVSLALTVALSLLFSLFLVIGSQLCEGIDSVRLRAIWTWAGVLINAIPIAALLLLLEEALNRRRGAGQIERRMRGRDAAFCFLVMLLCWLPVLMALYPGQFAGDVGTLYLGEWWQWSNGVLNDHHPVLHTVLMCSIIEVGLLFGSFNLGVFFFSIFQGIICALVFTYALAWLWRRGAPRWLWASSFVYFCLSPSISLFVFFSNCDTLSAALAVWLGLGLFDLVGAFRGELLPDRDKALLFLRVFTAGILFCCMRPNAAYALVAVAPIVVALVGKGNRLRASVLLLSILSAFLLWSGPIAHFLGVEESTLQKLNAFSLPIQQMTYVYMNGDLTPEELSDLERDGYIPDGSYKQDLADLARGSFEEMSSLDLLKNYVQIGFNHPGDYVRALILQTSIAWNPYGYLKNVSASAETPIDYSIEGVYRGEVPPMPLWCIVGASEPASQHSKLPALKEVIMDAATTLKIQSIPILALLVSLPFYIYTLLISLHRCILSRKAGSIAMLSLFLLLVVSVIVGPGVLVRYYMCLLFGLPVIVFALFGAKSEVNRKRN